MATYRSKILIGMSLQIYLYIVCDLVALQEEAKTDAITTVKRYASSLTISALNLFVPPIFAVLCTLEEYSPSFELAMNLFRYYLVLHYYVLLHTLNGQLQLFIQGTIVRYCNMPIPCG